MDLGVWQSAFASAVRDLIARTIAYLPTLAEASGLVLVGWILARVSRAAAVRVARQLTRRSGMTDAVERSRWGLGFAELLGGVVYWFVIALFVGAAVERLDLSMTASLVAAFAAFLPRVLVALLIVFAAILAARLTSAAVQRAASAAGLPQALLLARSVQAILIFFGIVTAADHVGIQSTLLTVVAGTAVGVVLGGATLAFGLGSRTTVSNIVGMHYLLKTYSVGQVVRIGEVEGPIVEVTQTGVLIASPEGRTLVPGSRFSQEVSTLVAGGRS